MIAQQATRSDLEKIFRSSASRMLHEYKIAEFSPAEAMNELAKRVDVGDAHALYEDGEPAALIAWFIQNETIHTAFAAREEFFTARTVRFCYDHVRRIQAENGNLPICSSSFSPHPRVPKWFKTLGFVIGQSEPPVTNYWLMPGPKNSAEITG